MREIKINFHYLNKCDMHCYHCFDRINDSNLDDNEIVETFKSLCIITKAINLVGGEVFTNIPLLKRLVKIGLENRVMLSIVSNGYILLNNLNNEDCIYILKNIKMIGISIDSFDSKTNQLIGREVDGKPLSLSKLNELKRFCIRYNTRLKINTVVSQKNLNEIFIKNITKIKPNIWKILQVSTSDESDRVSEDEFQGFLDRNQTDIDTSIEFSNNIKSAYLMVNAKGQLHFDGQFYNVNVNDQIDGNRYNAYSFFEKIEDEGIHLDNYFERYSIKENISFDKKAYHKNFRKKINKKGNILFLDVESFTPRPSESRDLLKYTLNQIHFLYCGLVVSKDLEILDIFSENIDFNLDIRRCIDKTWNHSQVFDKFYSDFLIKLKTYKIETIIVSGLDTETNFLLDAIYYIKKLNRKDFEYLGSKFKNLLDIQIVKKENIISSGSNQIASRNVNDSLNNFRSDIFNHQRIGIKGIDYSHSVSLQLGDIYLKQYEDIDKSKLINEIRNHCYKDVFDDFELFYSYDVLSKSSIS